MLDFTVAICTYNGANRIKQVLERLHSQVNPQGVRWEIVVVDNNSTDHLKQVIDDYQKSRFSATTLRYLFEPQQGVAFARLRAVQEARGNLIGFLDDDTLPDQHWVTSAYEFAQTHPQAGAYGGQIHGEFETEPFQGFKQIAIFLAIVERGSTPHLYTKVLPPGAGLIVRRQAWLESVPQKPFLSGRTTQSMLTSEDIAAIVHIQKAGWEIWYNPEQHLYHQIPAWRLERTYLLNLVRGIGLAKHHIRMMRLSAWQRPLAFPAYLIHDLIKTISYFIKHQKLLKKDLPTACQMELLTSSVASPFYLWSRHLNLKK
ncbi:MAG: hormogonium polysaccharide biosynthesis glycosyltransferase HpsE [Phormidesmis sp. CAN_BIN44]|nr:hormogonium polysaccharide biosynthesis glycosyltransferase HpsE [Phormidesmis sp. CAN_BIN44]